MKLSNQDWIDAANNIKSIFGEIKPGQFRCGRCNKGAFRGGYAKRGAKRCMKCLKLINKRSSK